MHYNTALKGEHSSPKVKCKHFSITILLHYIKITRMCYPVNQLTLTVIFKKFCLQGRNPCKGIEENNV